METNSEHDQQAFVRERAVLKEWNYLQQSLFTFASEVSHTSFSIRRQVFENHIARITERQALIWERNHTLNGDTAGSRFYEICYRQIRYGSLELAAGYLLSTLMPAIPRNFANLCALIFYLGEHEELVQYQLAHLPSSTPTTVKTPLTPREQDVLSGLMRCESKKEMALRLNVTEETIHTHLQRLYTTLNVKSGRQAIFRAFDLRVIDWSAMPKGDENSQA